MPWWESVIYLLFYATFIEFSQTFTPNRCAEGLDMALPMANWHSFGTCLYAGYKKLEAICAKH